MKKILSYLFLLAITVISVVCFGSNDPDMVMATLLFSVPASSTVTQTVQICPQYLVCFGNAVSAIEVSVGGQSQLVNLRNANQIQALANYRSITGGENNYTADAVIIPIANGYIANKNVTITITNTADGSVSIYGASLGRGDMFLQTLVTTVLQNSGQIFEDFTALIPVSPNAGDIVDVNFRDGFSDKWELQTMALMQTYVQNAGSIAAGGSVFPLNAVIDNAGQIVRNVTYTPAASNRDLLVIRWADVGRMKTAASFIPESVVKR